METSTENTTYQGWTNKETWCVNLHINNTQEWQNHALALCDKAKRDAPKESAVKQKTWSIQDAELYLLEDSLKDWVEGVLATEALHEGYSEGYARTVFCFQLDMILNGLGQVNWKEIASGLLETREEASTS